MISSSPLFIPLSISLYLLSFLLVAFGQPAWIPFFGVITSICGFVPIFWVLLNIENRRYKFWVALSWFALVEAVHLSWLLTHPFSYIYALYLFLILGMGAQFGLLALITTRERVSSFLSILGLSGFFVLMEWLRLFFLSGFPFNPIGLSLTSTLFGLQGASLFGIYGLTFLVLTTNFLFLRLLINPFKITSAFTFSLVALFPYLFGFFQVESHKNEIDRALQDPKKTLDVVLVQTAFPIEETIPFLNFREAVLYVQEEWRQIFKILASHQDHPVELIVLPEYVVPYGTFVAIFDAEEIEKLFLKAFPEKGKNALPPLQEPFAMEVEIKGLKRWQVTNGYICQALSNLFHADLIVGLQDDHWLSDEERLSYSSGFYFWPGGNFPFRYEKQVLLPIAEYFPFDAVKDLAKSYGVSGTFTKGEEAKVFPGCKGPFGVSICYEEAYGDLMRENRLKGAELLVNLSSDVWYPNSRLPKQHFDHARLRTVEMGIPLIRACNTGITAAFDSLGRVISSTGLEDEWTPLAVYAKVPLYHYQTLYTLFGDLPIVVGSLLFSSLLFYRRKRD